MKNLKINWKTTAAGVGLIILVVAHVLFPATITAAVMASGISIMAGLGLVAAKDGNVTGVGAAATTLEDTVLPLAGQLTAGSTNPTMEDIHRIIGALLTIKTQPTIVQTPDGTIVDQAKQAATGSLDELIKDGSTIVKAAEATELSYEEAMALEKNKPAITE